MRIAALLGAFPVSGVAGAAVISASANAVIIERTADIAIPPPRLWSLLIEPARWWSPRQSWSGDANNLTIDPRAGGCFCEKLPNGGSVEHLRVVHVDPGRMLRMTGGLGPLQADAVTGPLTMTLAPTMRGTRMTWRYAFAGVARIPLPVLGPIVDALLGTQIARLGEVAEGRPPAAVPASDTPSPAAK